MYSAVINFTEEADKKTLWANLKTLKGRYVVELKRFRRGRSYKQNRLLWGWIYPHVAAGFMEAWGAAISNDEVHAFCKQAFLSRPIIDQSSGEEKGRVPGSTAKLDVARFTEYVEKIRAFASEDLHVEIPEPDAKLTTDAATSPPANVETPVGDSHGARRRCLPQ